MAAAEAKDPREKLGALFWVLWATGFLVLTAGFIALMQWNMAQEHWSSVLAVIATIVFTVAVWSLSMLPYLLKRKRGVGPKLRPPIRRYMMRFMPAMLLYVIVLMPATELYQETHPSGVLAWVIALAPTIPLLFAIRAIMLYLKEEDDEFQRAMAVQAHVAASGLTMAICTVYGFLDLFGLVPHVQAWAVVPLWAVCLIPAQVGARWRFK